MSFFILQMDKGYEYDSQEILYILESVMLRLESVSDHFNVKHKDRQLLVLLNLT